MTRGLRYFYGQAYAALYTHTLPPNYTGRDCMNFRGNQFHLASRSLHPGGVNIVLCDGSVHFIRLPISILPSGPHWGLEVPEANPTFRSIDMYARASRLVQTLQGFSNKT